MLADWIKEVQTEVSFAKDEKERAEALITQIKDQLSEEQITEFRKLLATGQKAFDLVEFGNGVHNKKYSIMLIDEGLNSVYAVLDILEPLADEAGADKK
jgi:uncharacterized protein (DUF2164 family)